MAQTPQTTKQRQTPLIPGTTAPKRPSMRPALSMALDEIALKGRTQRDAARVAGLHEKSLSRALQKPHIAAWLEYQQTQAILDADQLKTKARAMAIRVGIDLLHSATSEAVKARLVEFFAGEPKTPAVAVQINNNAGAGYVYRPPDQASSGPASQSHDIEGKANEP